MTFRSCPLHCMTERASPVSLQVVIMPGPKLLIQGVGKAALELAFCSSITLKQ